MNELKKFEGFVSEKQKQFHKEIKEQIILSIKALIEKSNGKIMEFKWQQYSESLLHSDITEFWNDFYVNSYYIPRCANTNLEHEWQELFANNVEALEKHIQNYDSYEKWIEHYPKYALNPETRDEDLHLLRLIFELRSIIITVEDDVLKTCFGQSSEVTVYYDGTFNVKKYKHYVPKEILIEPAQSFWGF
jgi:hypothetical protein